MKHLALKESRARVHTITSHPPGTFPVKPETGVVTIAAGPWTVDELLASCLPCRAVLRWNESARKYIVHTEILEPATSPENSYHNGEYFSYERGGQRAVYVSALARFSERIMQEL